MHSCCDREFLLLNKCMVEGRGGGDDAQSTAVCGGSSGMCWLAKVLDVRRCCTKSLCPNADRAAAVLCQVKVEPCLGRRAALFAYIG